MEDLDAPTISELRDENFMSTYSPTTFSILSDIVNVVEYIHGQGLVYNDIKPLNIVWNKQRGAILINFGLGGSAA